MDDRPSPAGNGERRQNPAYRPTHPPNWLRPAVWLSCAGLGPPGVRKIAEHLVDGLPRLVVGVGPEVAVGVEGLRSAGVAQSGLHGPYGHPVVDQERGIVVAQVVEAQS
jgi:hypothetical protein